MGNFYDKIAKEFGGYGFSNKEPIFTSTYPKGDPELVFKKLILDNSSINNTALDVGCGDGRFTFEISPSFKLITGLDSSKGLINIANKKKRELHSQNTNFILADASKMPFKKDEFNLAFNRRGPSFYSEFIRVLKRGGLYIEIGIGEKDAMKLKQVFGRGQNYGDWVNSRLKTDLNIFKSLGFKKIYAKDFYYSELYENTDEFELFLRGVPIFEDFNINKDKRYLAQYYKDHINNSGQVLLDRHRVVYALRKEY